MFGYQPSFNKNRIRKKAFRRQQLSATQNEEEALNICNDRDQPFVQRITQPNFGIFSLPVAANNLFRIRIG